MSVDTARPVCSAAAATLSAPAARAHGAGVGADIGAGAEASLDVQVSVCRSLDALQSLQPEWSALLAACPDADLFMSPAWHLAWWQAFGEGRRPVVLACRRGQRLVAVLPLCRYRDVWRGLPLRVLGTYNNEHASRSSLLVAPGQTPAVAAALAARLRADAGHWDALRLRQLPAQAPWLAPLMEACRAEGLHLFGPTPGLGKCILPLAGGWSAFCAGRRHHFRIRLRESQQRLARHGSVVYRRSAGCAEDFAAFLRLEGRSWKGGDGGVRLGSAGWAFQQQVALAADAGMACFNLFLDLDGRPVGGVQAIGFRGVVYSLQMMFDESVRQLYAGRAQFGVHVADLFEDARHHTLDLNGNSPFCQSWSTLELPFVDLLLFHSRPYSALLAWLKQRLGRRR